MIVWGGPPHPRMWSAASLGHNGWNTKSLRHQHHNFASAEGSIRNQLAEILLRVTSVTSLRGCGPTLSRVPFFHASIPKSRTLNCCNSTTCYRA
ncbi:hypothetical protein EVAR_71697_1 [Eumeta japonica]|uniref:Uncharacterized protein n=1 Tax=Eumeta variegata TaxID=151549 RepID=A0A4C1SYJ3_EUMVA|nr:hypothetical protein EVAR_71697_1 [Eumeta japonica]